MQPPKRGQRSCQWFLGAVFGCGGIQRCVDLVSEAIPLCQVAIAERARSSILIFVDETSWCQHGVLVCLWVLANRSVAFFRVRASRSKQAFEELIGHRAGILVSDGYGVYRKWVNQRQTCPAHLLRKSVGFAERKDLRMARIGGRVASEPDHIINWANAPPAQSHVSTWYARMSHLLGSHKERKDEAGRLAK